MVDKLILQGKEFFKKFPEESTYIYADDSILFVMDYNELDDEYVVFSSKKYEMNTIEA